MKLNKELAKKVDKVESTGSREPIPAGVYQCRLLSIEAKQASTGNPMWVAVFEVVDEEYAGRRLWHNIVLIDNSLWKVREFFDAFEVPVDTDTDELLGKTCSVAVLVRVIGGGAREGQMGNNVDRLTPDGSAKKSAGAKRAATAKSVEAEFAAGDDEDEDDSDQIPF